MNLLSIDGGEKIGKGAGKKDKDRYMDGQPRPSEKGEENMSKQPTNNILLKPLRLDEWCISPNRRNETGNQTCERSPGFSWHGTDAK